HYDPKTRFMRDDPLPEADPNEKFYLGDNQYRNSGQALEFKVSNIHAWEAFDKGQDVHMQAAPTQVELLYKNFMSEKQVEYDRAGRIIKGQARILGLNASYYLKAGGQLR
ncbi:unnamed protein product, partial [Vicia faba]